MGGDRGSLVATVVLTTAVTTAAIVNVPQFAALELSTGGVYQALHVKAGHDLPALVDEHFDSTREDVQLFTQLRSLAPEATITIGASSTGRVTEVSLVGLALAERVDLTEGPLPSVDAATVAGWAERAVVTGRDEVLGDYAIVLGPSPVAALTVVQGPDRRYVVDDRLLDPEARE